MVVQLGPSGEMAEELQVMQQRALLEWRLVQVVQLEFLGETVEEWEPEQESVVVVVVLAVGGVVVE